MISNIFLNFKVKSSLIFIVYLQKVHFDLLFNRKKVIYAHIFNIISIPKAFDTSYITRGHVYAITISTVAMASYLMLMAPLGLLVVLYYCIKYCTFYSQQAYFIIFGETKKVSKIIICSVQVLRFVCPIRKIQLIKLVAVFSIIPITTLKRFVFKFIFILHCNIINAAVRIYFL